jgi:hypothetical protein
MDKALKRGDEVLYFDRHRSLIRKDSIDYWNVTDDGRRIGARLESSYYYVKSTLIIGRPIELTET